MCIVSLAAAQDAQPKPEAPTSMAANADPAYEVAAIKLADPDSTNTGFYMRGRRMVVANKTLRQMFFFAYSGHPKQLIAGLPESATEHYDVDGVLDTPGQPSLIQMKSVVQKLLAERFALKFHSETQLLSVYVLSVAPGGPRIAKTKAGPDDVVGHETDDTHNGMASQNVFNRSMSQFAVSVQGFLDRPVVDQTGLAGKWDLKWTWTTDESRLPPDIVNPPPGIFTAIQEQLGLKLEAKKAPCTVYIVDHVQGPSAN